MTYDAEDVAMTVVPMTTATISFIGSSLIIVMIWRSKKKLKDAYRRIVFGMSVFDILSSLAVALKVFKSTPDSNMWLHQGNQTSCNILGFMHMIGAVGTPIYSVNLNIYYFYLVKQNMREEVFQKKIEPWLHGVPVVWSIVGGLYIWTSHLINPGPSGACFIATFPLGCSKDDDVECIRGDNQFLVTMLYLGGPIVLCLIVSMALLIAIWCKVRSQEVRMDRYRIRRVSMNMQDSLTAFDGRENDTIARRLRYWRLRRRGNKRTMSNSRAFMWSAIWYAVAFMATYTFPYIVNVMNNFRVPSPFLLRLLSRILQPLQGLFNILVYTRPHVKVCRENNEDWTWFRAFSHVVMSGGDDDQRMNERRRSRRASSTRSCSSNTLRSSGPSNIHSPTSKTRVTSMFGPLRRQSGRDDAIYEDINEVRKMMIGMNDIDEDLTNTANAKEGIPSSFATCGRKSIPCRSLLTTEGSQISNFPEADTQEDYGSPLIVCQGGDVGHDATRRRSVRFTISDTMNEGDTQNEAGHHPSAPLGSPTDEETIMQNKKVVQN